MAESKEAFSIFVPYFKELNGTVLKFFFQTSCKKVILIISMNIGNSENMFCEI